MYWLITNRNIGKSGFGDDFSSLSYWKNESGKLEDFASWSRLTATAFRQALVAVTDTYPDPLQTPVEKQKHLTVLIHGFNNTWQGAAGLYQNVAANLFSGVDSLGECVLFSWPSKGSPLGYYPDRSEARQAADDLADVLSALYDWMSIKQVAAAKKPEDACRAKTSVIAHSMGNYVLQNAMQYAWTRKNQPLLVSLISQLLMVAADVDNDIFRSGDTVHKGDGEGIANLSYRITALYTGRDSVLGMSAGLKHFGKRRLGRSGLDRTCPVPDNVWDIDCTQLIDPAVDGMKVHSAYFNETKCYDLMRALLRGIDRTILIGSQLIPPAQPKVQAAAG
jgi:esterase/lipase superfamily enzyme